MAISADHPLSRLFRQLVERNFALPLDWQDRTIIQYLSQLLTDFTHVRNLYRLRGSRGRRLEDVAEMLLEGDLLFRATTSSYVSLACPRCGRISIECRRPVFVTSARSSGAE